MLAVLSDSGAVAQLAPPEPTRAPGEIVIATSQALAPTVRRAAAAAERVTPSVHFRVDAVGSDVAMAELYSAKADAAVIGRDATDNEIKAYTWIYGRPPIAKPVATGTARDPGRSQELAILVNAANPLRGITPAQIRTAFSASKPPPTWGDLGLKGVWAGRPVRLVIPNSESGTGRFVRHALLADAVQFDWGRVIEMALTTDDAAADRSIDAAVAHDPLALGFGTATRVRRSRTVALNAGDGFLLPGAFHYPLKREIMIYMPAAVLPLSFEAALAAEFHR